MRTLRLGSSGSQARLWQLTHARFSKAVSVALVLGEWLSRDWIAAAALLALVVLPSVARAVDYDLWDYEPTVVGDAKTIGMWGAAIAHTNNPDSTLHRTEYFPAHGALLPQVKS